MPKIYGQLEQAQLQNVAGNLTGNITGRLWLDTTAVKVKFQDGTLTTALLANDQKCVFGTSGTAGDNIRLNRGASGLLQLVTGGDTTAEGSLSSALAQLSFKFENYASGSRPSNGNSGRTIWNTTSKKLQVDNGTGWDDVGSGSGGSINYIGNPNAQNGTTGFATYADAAGSLPVDGTGGSPTVTWTTTTSSPLRGDTSFLFTKDAANRQGQGASYDFTIDSADQGKILQISLDYAVASGTLANGDLVLSVLDVTNSVLIPVDRYQIYSAATGLPVRHTAVFQTPTNSTSLRLILHCASTSASAFTVKVDNISVGPQVFTNGAIVTDWQTFTPTGSWVSGTSAYTGQWRRVGDSMEGWIKITQSGAPTSTSLTVNLPSGYSIDTSKINAADNNSDALGFATTKSAAATYPANVAYESTTSLRLRVLSSGNLGFITQASPATYTSGDNVTIWFRVPILGWASTIQLSSDAGEGRLVGMEYWDNGGQALTADVTDITFSTKIRDTHSSWSGTQFTAPLDGFYNVTGNIKTTASISSTWDIYVGGVQARRFGYSASQTTHFFSGQIYLTRGQVLSVRSSAACTLASSTLTHNICITKVPASALGGVGANETVAMRANASSTTINNTSPIVIQPTVQYDTHGAYSTSTGRFTCPVSGKYRLTASIRTASASFSFGDVLQPSFYKNGSALGQFARPFVWVATTMNLAANGSDEVNCVAGDILDLRCYNGLGVALTGDSANFFSISRIGN